MTRHRAFALELASVSLISAGLGTLACQDAADVGAETALSHAEPAEGSPSAAPEDGSARAEQKRAPLPPLVDLYGKSPPHDEAAAEPGPRIYSRAMRTWIHEKPSKESKRIGYLRAGASSLTSAEPHGHDGCRAGWYPVSPEGFICAGRRATLDEDDSIVRATIAHPPNFSRKLPYIYGTVRRRGPIYARLPSRDELVGAESDVEERMPKWLDAGGEIGASYAQHVWLGGHPAPDPRAAWESQTSDPVPWFLRDGGIVPNIRGKKRDKGVLTLGRMGRRVGHSFLHTFLHDGRRYGLTTDLRLFPTDRLRPIQGSSYHGFNIPEQIDFPFAIIRHPKARFWVYQKSKNKLIDAGAAEYRSAVKLTGKQKFFRKRLHFETVDGKYVSDRHASRLDPVKRMPAWGKQGEKWIDINLTKQTMLLLDGTRPVYATLISSGEAGLEDPAHTTATKRGIFRVHTKHVTATMSSDEVGEAFELRDVPYVQYFDGDGFAIHGAYWHDRFGTPKSHGCINLAPEDARRIFHFTEPQVPRGWHGALLPLKGTVVFIHP